MPQETFTWDRKEFPRDRNHNRSSEPRHYSHPQPHLHPHPYHQFSRGGGGYNGVGRVNGGGPRWREHNFFPNYHRPYTQTNDHHQSPRWVSDTRCRQGPSGYGNQGGRHFHEEEGRGFVSSRSRDKSMVDESTFRVSASRKFIRYNRENKSFGKKEWKDHYTDTAPLPGGSGTQNGMADKSRLVDDVLTSNASCSHAVLAKLHDRFQLKKHHEENDNVRTEVDASRKCEGEASIGASEKCEGEASIGTSQKCEAEALIGASQKCVGGEALIEAYQKKCEVEASISTVDWYSTKGSRMVIDDVLNSNASNSHADLVELHDQSQLKKQHEDNDTIETTIGVSQKCEDEASIDAIDDLEFIKSSHTVHFSSCGSGISYTNSSKDTETDSFNSKDEVQQTDISSIRSPSCEVANPIEVPPAACESLASPSEDSISRKKPRLRWGEGLSKFEKKKVEGVDDCETRNILVVYERSLEPLPADSTKSANKSPNVNVLSDSATRVTPTAVGYSYSTGIEEKQYVKANVFDHDTANLSSPSSIVVQNNVEGSTFNLEIMDQDSIACLDSAIDKLLQSDCQSSGDSVFVRSTAMNKLLVWKSDMLKTLVSTESEIDNLEVQLKSMTELKDSHSKPSINNDNVVSRVTFLPASLNIVLDGDSDVCQKTNSEVLTQVNNTIGEDVESPGSATSKLVDVFFSEKDFALKQEIVAATVLVKSSIGSVISGDKLCESILASNRDTANRVAEEFNKLLQSKQSSFDIRRSEGFSCVESSEIIKANLLRRKRFQQFHERVLALRFRVLQHFWNQDVRLLSMKKNRVKSQKKLDHRLLALQNVKQKSHLSIHSRYSCSPGIFNFTPDVETIKFVRKLISKSRLMPLRKALKMPALTLDKKENMATRFLSTNGLMEDPCVVEKDMATMNIWTEEEIEIFLGNFSIYGKDFTKIATFITHKTTADCIEFYYKNHKSEFFKKATKKYPDLAKRGKSYPTGNYLVTTGKRLIFEANDVTSLNILGEVSALAANGKNHGEIEPKCTSRGSRYLHEKSTSFDAYDDERERETVAADVLAGICSSLSSEAMGSCITSVFDRPAEGGYHNKHTNKIKRIRSSNWRHLEPDIKDVDETCSDHSCGEKMDPIDWTDEEKSIFVQAVSSNGKDFAMISRRVRKRSIDQCKSFFSKARKCLALDVICPESTLAVRSGFNPSSYDMSNVCVEVDSCICEEKLVLINEANMPSLSNSELESVNFSKLEPVYAECHSINLVNDKSTENLDQRVDGNDKHYQNCNPNDTILSVNDNDAESKYVSDDVDNQQGNLLSKPMEQYLSGCSLGHNVEHLTMKDCVAPGTSSTELNSKINSSEVVSHHDQHLVYGLSENRNCDGSKQICSATEFPFHSVEQMRKNCSQLNSSLGMEKSRQNGKVKLFGQILSKPSNRKSSPTMQNDRV